MVEIDTSTEAVAAGVAPLPERSPEWALKLAFMDALFLEDGNTVGYADRMVDAVKRLGWASPAEIRRLNARVDELLEANNREVERRRAARREGIEAAAAICADRARARNAEVGVCFSDRSRKHMNIRADEAGQIVAAISALLDTKDSTRA